LLIRGDGCCFCVDNRRYCRHSCQKIDRRFTIWGGGKKSTPEKIKIAILNFEE
jgi:hypothetical protein